MRQRRLFSRIKRLLDAWSVPHFMFGMVMAMGAIAFLWSLTLVFSVMVICAVLWEYVERYFRIHEAKGNPSMDIVLPMLGFGSVLILVDQAPLHHEQNLGLFFWIVVLYAVISGAAWKARLEKDWDFLR